MVSQPSEEARCQSTRSQGVKVIRYRGATEKAPHQHLHKELSCQNPPNRLPAMIASMTQHNCTKQAMAAHYIVTTLPTSGAGVSRVASSRPSTTSSKSVVVKTSH